MQESALLASVSNTYRSQKINKSECVGYFLESCAQCYAAFYLDSGVKWLE